MGLGDLYTEAPDHKRAAWASHSMLPIVDTPNLAYCWTTAKRGVEEGVKLGLLNIGKIAERVDFMLLTFDGPLMRLKVHRRSKNVQSGGSNFVTSFVAEVEVDSSDKRGVMYEILKVHAVFLARLNLSADDPLPFTSSPTRRSFKKSFLALTPPFPTSLFSATTSNLTRNGPSFTTPSSISAFPLTPRLQSSLPISPSRPPA